MSSKHLLYVIDRLRGYAQEWPLSKFSTWESGSLRHWVMWGDPELAKVVHLVAAEADLRDTETLRQIDFFSAWHNDKIKSIPSSVLSNMQIWHLTKPTIVDQPGKYVTRGGEIVTVDQIKGRVARGSYSEGIKESWVVTGHVLPFSESKNDIMGKAP